MSFFEKYLSIWVILCICIGIFIGEYLPSIPLWLSKFEIYNISLPITILIWIMICPMMMKVDFFEIINVGKRPKGIFLTLIINWIIKPFSMYVIAYAFFFYIYKSIIPINEAEQYLAGAVLLGAAPCTAMVFVWSYLTKGNAAYTLVQVAINDLIILIAFIPIVALLLGIGGILIPYGTLFLSIILFVVIPLIIGFWVRIHIIKKNGIEYFRNIFIKKFDKITMCGLLLTLIILFAFQGKTILANPIYILLIAIPLIIQTFFIFFIAYFAAYFLKLPHTIAAPAAMIGASNFFELSVAVAISLFGLSSGAALATVVGVLVEVPVMLILVKIANSSKKYFIYK